MEEIVMNEYVYVQDEVKDEDVVIVINDYYSSREICEYMIPVPETESLNYSIVTEKPTDEYYQVDYAL